MKNIKGGEFTGERALYSSANLKIENAHFHSGESPLKESCDIELSGCKFSWKYPLWYCRSVSACDTLLEETARSGIWYTHGISMTDCVIEAPKTFRRSSGIRLKGVRMPYALESMWNCSDVELDGVYIKGDYFGFGTTDVVADGIEVDGNYLFDGGKNITVRNSRLISKDAFWNCENVTVENCYIEGEYLGWNSKNLKLVNCTVESDQGMCYIDGIEMINCKVINTPLAFEYSKVNADITTKIDSVKNPASGRIKAPAIGELIMEESRVDTALTEIITEVGNE